MVIKKIIKRIGKIKFKNLLLFLLFFGILIFSFITYKKVFVFLGISKSAEYTPQLVYAPTPTESPAPTQPQFNTPTVYSRQNTQTKPPDWTVKKVDEHTTESQFPPDSRMATPDELFAQINSYRLSHGINEIQKNSTLCGIAQSRASDLYTMGKLDTHEGLKKYFDAQNDFYNIGEILHGGTQPNLAVHIVEWGWGRSLTGHKEAMEDPKWTHGCGGIAGYFSVFIFGRR